MIKWIILLSLIGIPIIFLGMASSQEPEMTSDSGLGTVSIIKVGEDFIKKTSSGNSTEENILGLFRDITEEEILKETALPNLADSEKIMNNGLHLTANYNQISYDYSVGKITDEKYFLKLLDFRIKYETYMTSMDSYIGDDDILILRNSMIEELKEINQQIIVLKNYQELADDWELVSEYDRYKKFLPSMFAP